MSGRATGDLIEVPERISGAECHARSEGVRQQLAAGRAKEAAALAVQLAKAAPGYFYIWILLADCQAVLGDSTAEIAALEAALKVQPFRAGARARLAKLLVAGGELSAAVAHYQLLSEGEEPVQPKLLLQLTRLYRELDQPEQEAAAWSRFLAIEPNEARGHHRLAQLLMMAGRSLEAIPHARRALEAYPQNAKFWALFAAICEDTGQLDEAEGAWRRVLERHPGNPTAEQRLAEVEMLKGVAAPALRSGSAVAAGVKVLGNCQAVVLARCLRQLNPDLQVTSVNWSDLVSSRRIQYTADGLDHVDTVIVQPVSSPRLACLSPKALAARGLRTVCYPSILFSGFHPDALHARSRAGLRSLIGDWHSALVLAGYRLGLPPHRTAELFNAYIYGVLGYFDEFGKAEHFLGRRARQAGWDLSVEFEAWRSQGCFVHTPNHPRIGVMMSLARRVCRSLELEFDPDAVAPPDPFGSAWPVYPEIGKRLGVAGALAFTTIVDGGRCFDIEGAVGWFYDVYRRASPDALPLGRVDETIRILKAEGI